jgi:hypothetical protein
MNLLLCPAVVASLKSKPCPLWRLLCPDDSQRPSAWRVTLVREGVHGRSSVRADSSCLHTSAISMQMSGFLRWSRATSDSSPSCRA